MGVKERCKSIFGRCKHYGINVSESLNTVEKMSLYLISIGLNENLDVCLIDKYEGYVETNIVLSKNKTGARSRVCDHGTSKFKGVGWYKSKNMWRARIKIDGVHKHLGYFENENDAAKEYNIHAVLNFGQLAKLNDINAK